MRHNKTHLLLMEQMVMLLVFALAAAVCLQAFVRADAWSRESVARDRAVVLCQSAAEAIRACDGDFSAAAALLELPYGAYAGEGLPFEAHYNEDWSLSDTREYAYCLRARPVEDAPAGLGKARVWVEDAAGGGELFRLEAAWQTEVSAHG